MEDTAEIARLAAQLGYPSPIEAFEGRLGRLLAMPHQHVAVVNGAGGRLLGWVHVEQGLSLQGGDRAEIMGLVVDAPARRGGVGRVLVREAEDWAAARGLGTICVRSNAAREASHAFYAALGYARDKTQHVYRKPVRLTHP
jgi:GNAT superfamily N-acetyltransferase